MSKILQYWMHKISTFTQVSILLLLKYKQIKVDTIKFTKFNRTNKYNKKTYPNRDVHIPPQDKTVI